ncbi:hypothetical protein ACFFRR_000785 [Megaselia abdita]
MKDNENPAWLTQDIFQTVLESKYGKHFRIKSFAVQSIDNPWDKTPTYRVQIDLEFKIKNSSTIFGCGNKKCEESISYLLRMSPLSEIQMYDKVIPAFEKLYSDKGRKVVFSQNTQKMYHNKVLLFEDPKSKCLQKIKDFSDEDLRKVLKNLADFHAASAIYAENNDLENLAIKVDKGKDILDVFIKKVKPTIVKTCENGEYLADKFFGEQVNDYFDWNEFNVLNHGQFWPNNILFGDSDNIYFTDFKLPKFGSPALDLYYFLLSAMPVGDKTKKFDYFIKYYYDCLIENLKFLGYKKEIPYLTDLRISLIRHGIWARIAICGVVGISLCTVKGNLYSNEKYVSVLQELLPWLDNRGLLEHRDPPKIPSKEEPSLIENVSNNDLDSRIPSWIKSGFFEEIVKKEMKGFSKITKFKCETGTTAGENYASLLLRVFIEAELEGVDNSAKQLSYILKTSHGNDMTSARDLDALGLFERETEMYKDILPLFEKLYENRKINVKFGPKCYNLAGNPGVDHLVLEDLKLQEFKNANRLEGLDIKHVESVLSLMAKYHAASAVAFETIKPYSECLTVGFFDKRNREMFTEFSRGLNSVLQETMINNYDNGEYYANKLVRDIYEHTDEIFDFYKVKPDEFNVLNHGDCWSNNIMFKYNDKNELTETIFVDFQLSKYGSPVADLYYFLLSSAAVDIKIKKFDYFIRYYHEHLVKNLNILGYPKQAPSLTDLHVMLVKNSVIARNVVIGVMGAVLLDSTENANMDNFIGVDDAGLKFKQMIFTNPRYKRALSEILPWMDNKGLLG